MDTKVHGSDTDTTPDRNNGSQDNDDQEIGLGSDLEVTLDPEESHAANDGADGRDKVENSDLLCVEAGNLTLHNTNHRVESVDSVREQEVGDDIHEEVSQLLSLTKSIDNVFPSNSDVVFVSRKGRSSTTRRHQDEVRNGVDYPKTTAENGANVVVNICVSENIAIIGSIGSAREDGSNDQETDVGPGCRDGTNIVSPLFGDKDILFA